MAEHEAPPRAATAVVWARVVLLALAVAGVVTAFVLARRTDEDGDRYVCPMHAEVVARAPGKCPVCGMALERVRGDSERPDVRDLVRYDVTTLRVRTFSVQVRAPAWLEPDGALAALAYKDELGLYAADGHGTFVPSAAPDTHAPVHFVPGTPDAWDGSTVRVRFALDEGGPALRPGATGWITLAPTQQQVVVVPYVSVLYSAAGPYVLVQAADGHGFQRRPVELGKSFFGLYAVVSGVEAGDRIAGDAAFLFGAEERLRETWRPAEQP